MQRQKIVPALMQLCQGHRALQNKVVSATLWLHSDRMIDKPYSYVLSWLRVICTLGSCWKKMQPWTLSVIYCLSNIRIINTLWKFIYKTNSPFITLDIHKFTIHVHRRIIQFVCFFNLWRTKTTGPTVLFSNLSGISSSQLNICVPSSA